MISPQKPKTSFLKKIVWLVIAIAILASAYVTKVYINWNTHKSEIIGKLFDYKKQLDRLRIPLPSEETTSDVTVGTVAIPSRVYDQNEKLIGEFFTERRTLINFEKIPQFVTQALISSEDRKFYEHRGIRYTSILRAIIKNVLTFQYTQGGSTLTQQLAKVLFTNQEKTLERKIFELFCTQTIEERFTKTQILEMYLNLIYMGHGNFGIESASEYYFNKSTEFLTMAEAAVLVGLLPSPERYSPINDLEKSTIRQKRVLKGLVETGKISQNRANQELARYYQTWGVKKLNNKYVSVIGKFPDRAYRINLAPYFLDMIRQELLKTYSSDELMKGGLRIYTTLDYDRQKAAEIALKKAILEQKKYYESKALKAKKIDDQESVEFYRDALEKTNGAFVTINPQTGYILTMIGGTEFSASNQFNRVTKAYRQVGSLLKPFIYYLAINKKKLTPASILKDEPVTVGNFDFHNYDGEYLGDMTVYDALKKSRNTLAVKTLQLAGISNLRTLLEDILTEDLGGRIPQEIGIALGTPAFSPMEIAQIYATLVNNGRSVKPIHLLRIEDSHNRLLWSNSERPEENQILDPESSYIIIQILESILEKGGTAGWVADLKAKNKDILNFEIAGKTGTTSDHKDAWFSGISSDEVSIVWIGSDMNAPLGEDKSGGSICSPVWIEYIQNARKKNPPAPFKNNFTLSNITTENFCLESGGVPRKENSCPDAVKNMSFISGTEPDFFCPLHK